MLILYIRKKETPAFCPKSLFVIFCFFYGFTLPLQPLMTWLMLYIPAGLPFRNFAASTAPFAKTVLE